MSLMIDKEGIFYDNHTVMLAINDKPIRKLGTLSGDTFYTTRSYEKHLFRKYNGYAFNYEFLTSNRDFNFVIINEEREGNVNLYVFDRYIFFTEGIITEEEGFDKQVVVPLESIYKYKITEVDIQRIKMLGAGWYLNLKEDYEKIMPNIGKKLGELRKKANIYPSKDDMFRAYQLTPYHKVKVVCLGQDPYHDGSADGLAFSTRSEEKYPPSLKQILNAMSKDKAEFSLSEFDGDLTRLATQGVFLINRYLSVEAGKPLSHAMLGWDKWTDSTIKALMKRPNIVWMLWGKESQQSRNLITNPTHLVLEAEHPVAASYRSREWEYDRCFAKCNNFLKERSIEPIKW